MEVPMMTHPALAIKNEVRHLIEVQIDMLRKQSSLTPAELVEYHSRSEKIASLYHKLDSIARRHFDDLHPKIFLKQMV
jgi:hypothetical protein